MPGWYYGGVKALQWKDRYWTSVKFVNDRWCAWVPVHESMIYDGIWHEDRPAPLCSAQPAQIPPGGANPAAAFDNSIYEATLRAYEHVATYNPDYGAMLLAGYGPVRVALDHWWEGAWMIGAVTGLRPLNSLDWQLDELLWYADPVVSRFAGGSDTRTFGTAVDYVYETASQQPSSYEERSLLVGFGLEHGKTALLQLGVAATLFDHDLHVSNADGTSSYPMSAHTYYIRHRQHSVDEVSKYYSSQSIGEEIDDPNLVRHIEALYAASPPSP